ncbi:phage portal protein [uncultured Brevundimonas sp.]|uniref:phage portal protein n=1 Tax=uncultured Brevundimonas sp. TaxID=213418 RepID=UPI00262435C6|nr:phage portal protein [uncultured Brevundimonas sp.]
MEQALRGGLSGAGVAVTATTALRVGAVYACVRIICGGVANLPLHVKRRVDARMREDASDHALWSVLRRKPNAWQTPSLFRRQMQACLLLRGNAYAQVVRSMGRVVALNPLHPDRMEVTQNDDLTLRYTYTRKDGGRVQLAQEDVFHLVGMTLDGIKGVSVISYARETIGLALAQEHHGATTFKNGARPSGSITHKGKLGPEGVTNLRDSLDAFRAGGENEGKFLILEEDMTVNALSMTAEDAQWIESRKFSRADIAMFFGVPPHMIGDTEKSTSWGTGIEQQSIGFVTWTMEDHLTAWEEGINLRLVGDDEPDIYARFNRAALVRGDLKARWQAYQIGRQMEVLSANDVRALEDMNPVDGGDTYRNPAINVTETIGDEPEKAS